MNRFTTWLIVSLVAVPISNAGDELSQYKFGLDVSKWAERLLAEKCPVHSQTASLQFVEILPKPREQQIGGINDVRLVCSTSREALFVFGKGKKGEWGFTVYLESASKPAGNVANTIEKYRDKSVFTKETGRLYLDYMPIRVLTPGYYKEDIHGETAEGDIQQSPKSFYKNLEAVELGHDLSTLVLHMNGGTYKIQYRISKITNNWDEKRVSVGENRVGLSKSQILRVVRGGFKQIRSCYEVANTNRPKLTGTLKVKFVIGPKGYVKSAERSSSSLKSASMEICVLDRIKSWKFPPPENNKDFEVTYPFEFHSQ